jgi:tRNA-Thr(GGU) m(6)t(6)A37 methyltransferase TsaA
MHTPFRDRVGTPRQPHAAGEAEGTIELVPGKDLEHALSDLEGWDYLWVVFVFHLNVGKGWRPKVLPPRSKKRRGVLATRAPYRPNPIGMSAVRLVEVSGLTLRVRDVDMIDGSPVLDIKPYVPWADAHPGARTGWLEPLSSGEGAGDAGGETPKDPEPGFQVEHDARAAAELAWLRERHGIDLAPDVERILSLGPQPHPYRRIRRDGDAMRLALQDWRVRFRVEGRRVIVESLWTGYRASQLAGDEEALEAHRGFVKRFKE